MAQNAQALLDYEHLEELIGEMGVLATAAEFHGTLCGQLSAPRPPEPHAWLKVIAALFEGDEQPGEDAEQGLLSFYSASREQFIHHNLDLQLMLPDDDSSLADRLEALGDWCRGYLQGLGFSGVSLDALSKDARSALQDLEQIGQISTETEESQESEQDYMEIYEYVRMAALLLFTEFQGQEAAPQASQQLH